MKIVLLLCTTIFSVFAQSDSVANRLAQTERDFSKIAGVKGVKSAFLTYFDDNCVAFYPEPVNGKQAVASESESPALLAWWPTFVEISSSGDFGFTTGPSEYRAGGVADSVVYYGHFVSVWKKNNDGDWKVILDVGSSYPKDEKEEEKFVAKELWSCGVKKPASVDAGRSEMMTADSAFSDAIRTRGSVTALQKFAAEDVRVYRKGSFPKQGKKNGLELIKGEKALRFNLYAGSISSTADLGFTYGIAVGPASDTSSYIRIWRNENEWKLVIDVLKPWPAKK